MAVPLTLVCSIGQAQNSTAEAVQEPLQPGSSKRRVLVLDLANEGAEEAHARLVRELLTTEIGKREDVEVISAEDMRRILEMDAEKQALGCDEETGCLAEIANALGAELVVYGTIGRLGDLIVLNVSLFDSIGGRSVAREKTQVSRIEALPNELQTLASRLFSPSGKPDTPVVSPVERENGSVLTSPVFYTGLTAAGAAGLLSLVAGAGGLLAGATILHPASPDEGGPSAGAKNEAALLGAGAAGIALLAVAVFSGGAVAVVWAVVE